MGRSHQKQAEWQGELEGKERDRPYTPHDGQGSGTRTRFSFATLGQDVIQWSSSPLSIQLDSNFRGPTSSSLCHMVAARTLNEPADSAMACVIDMPSFLFGQCSGVKSFFKFSLEAQAAISSAKVLSSIGRQDGRAVGMYHGLKRRERSC